MASKYRNAGQTCVCANRLIVQEGVYDDFVARLTAKVQSSLRVGNGAEAGVHGAPASAGAQGGQADRGAGHVSSGDQDGSDASVGVITWRSLKPAISICASREE